MLWFFYDMTPLVIAIVQLVHDLQEWVAGRWREVQGPLGLLTLGLTNLRQQLSFTSCHFLNALLDTDLLKAVQD